MHGAGEPAVVVYASVAEDIEVLSEMVSGAFCVSKRGQHRDAVHRLLLEPIHLISAADLRGLQDRWSTSMT